MDRAEFFKVVARQISRWYSIILFICFACVVIMRIINTELSLLISWVALIPVLPALCVLVVSSSMRMLDLHRHFYKGEAKYKAPSLFSLRLTPFNIVIAIVTLVPPVVLVSMLFGLEGHRFEYTALLSTHVLLCSLSVWYFWVINPYIKRMVLNDGKP